MSFQNNGDRTSYTRYHLPHVEVKNYNVAIGGQNFFDQPVKNHLIKYNIQKIGTGQGGDYTTGCLLDYNYLNNYYKMIAIDLSKQQANQFYCKSRSRKKHHNVFHYWGSKRNHFRFLAWNSKSIVNLF